MRRDTGSRVIAQALLSSPAWFFQWSQNFCWGVLSICTEKVASILRVVLKLKIIRIQPCVLLWTFPTFAVLCIRCHSTSSVSITTASLPGAGDCVQNLLQNLPGVISRGFGTLSVVPVVFLGAEGRKWTNQPLPCFTFPVHRDLISSFSSATASALLCFGCGTMRREPL